MKINCIKTSFEANKMSKKQAHALDNSLKKTDYIDILCHETSDRDTANSALAMWQYLKNQGINSRIIISQNLESLKLRNTDCEFVQASDRDRIEAFKPRGVLCVDFSDKDRIPSHILARLYRAQNTTGIDHHKNPNIVDDNLTHICESYDNFEGFPTTSSFYVDSSAKSATSVIYRFFEALGYEYDNNTAYDLFYGLVDDCSKKALVKCDGKKGTIETSKKLEEDKNAFEIYENLKNRLSEDEIKEIAKNIDVMSSLSPKEEEFCNWLEENIRFSKNKKLAYVEIPPHDEKWIEIGRDNSRSSTILNRFRQKMLQDYPDIQVAFCFYEAGGDYRLSAHSRFENLLDFFKYIDETKMPGFCENSGGHQSRGGGKIATTDKKSCHNWVEDILSCADFYDD